jgi:hypothetical protein
MVQGHQSDSLTLSTDCVADCQSEVSSEPTLLSEVKKEGNFVLVCKVNISFLYDIWLTGMLYKQLLYLKSAIFWDMAVLYHHVIRTEALVEYIASFFGVKTLESSWFAVGMYPIMVGEESL